MPSSTLPTALGDANVHQLLVPHTNHGLLTHTSCTVPTCTPTAFSHLLPPSQVMIGILLVCHWTACVWGLVASFDPLHSWAAAKSYCLPWDPELACAHGELALGLDGLGPCVGLAQRNAIGPASLDRESDVLNIPLDGAASIDTELHALAVDVALTSFYSHLPSRMDVVHTPRLPPFSTAANVVHKPPFPTALRMDVQDPNVQRASATRRRVRPAATYLCRRVRHVRLRALL